MPSERVQRQIDRLLDEAESAIERGDWPRTRELSESVLRLDPDNADARSYLEAAQRENPAGSPPATPSQPAAIPEPPSAPPLPTSFAGGRYAVRAFLGEGAKKRVYLAHDTRLDRDVAFALIKTEGLDADGIVRVRREAQAMGRLGDHAHIVTIHDTGDEGVAPFIVSQYRSGGSVEDLLAKAEGHRIAPERAMRIAEQVCQALEHAHGRGIIHRDLKPGNVWLDSDGNAALGDFGLAIAIDRSRMTMQGMMVGTVAYMPPEQALGRTPDARSDLYALGAMLYEMVCGRPPFLGDDAVGVISQHINTAPVAPSWHSPDCPKPLEALILRLLAKSPDERPATAQDVAQELRRILERSTIDTVHSLQADAATDLRSLDWGRFVGRHTEMEQLKSALEQTLSGKASVAFIAGEPGIGKTRLAGEFAVYAGLRGAQVLTGHSYEGESTVPYRPFVEAFREYTRSRPDGELRTQLGPGAPEIATLVSEIRQRFPDLQAAPQLEAEAERLRLFDSITTFVHNASIAQPLVLFLDDLHWADKPSLLLLQHVARHAAGDRLLVLATYRDVELDRTHPLSEALSSLRRLDRFFRIPLRGLPADEVFELLNSIESAEETAAGRHVLAQAIWRETEGNPFFIKEVLQHLVETGKLKLEGGHWTAGGLTISDLGIPEGVREVIGRRLSRLSEPCNRMLTRLSALTRGFTWDQLRAVNADEREDEVLDLLDEALRAQLVAERKGETPTTYDFTHALIRQTLYDELSTPRRALLHRQIGQAFEQLYAANIDAHVGELAYHFYQAAAGGDAAKAIDYATRAGDRAAALNGHDDAITHYERALQVVDMAAPDDQQQRGELLIKLGDVQWKSGHPDMALPTYRAASDAARSIASSLLLARAAIGFGEAAWRVEGDVTLRPESERVLKEALDALGDVDDPLRVHATGLWTRATRPKAAERNTLDIAGSGGYQSYLGGRDEEQLARVRDAVEMARRIGDPALVAGALFHLRGCMWRPDNPEERLAVSRDMRRYAVAAHDTALEAEACAWEQVDLLDLGDLDGYEATIQAMERLAALTRQPYHRWFPATYRAALALCMGPLDEADRLMLEALRAGQEGNAPEAVAAFGAQLQTIRREQGRSQEVLGLMREALRGSPNSFTYQSAVLVDLIDCGKLTEARELLKEIVTEGFEAIPRDYLWLVTVYLLADACYFLDEREWAAPLYDLAAPAARLFATIGGTQSVGSMHGPLALLATTLERYDAAEQHYNEGIARNDATRHYLWSTRLKRSYADMLLRRKGEGDRERALELLQQTLDAAQAMGMKKVVDDCLALKMGAQGVSSGDIYASIDAVARVVEAEKPDLRTHAAPDGTVTIMFSDIEDSTVLTERLGDQAWQDLLRKHNALIREQLHAHDGYEVKTMGDGFMVAFQSAKKGLDCAIAIQRAFDAHNAAAGEHVKVRIGLHAGEAIKDGDDFYGKNVILASRVAGKAVGGEILVSSLLRQLVESSVGASTFSEPREVELKGLSGMHTVYRIQDTA